MSFIKKSNNEFPGLDIFSYVTENLKFTIISNHWNDSFILYKQKLNANEYQIKDIIINILNNYLKIHKDLRLYSYMIKFVNFDDIVYKLLDKYENYDPYLLFINMDIEFTISNIISYVYNIENNMNFEIISALDSNLYHFEPSLSFEEVYTEFVKNISKKVKMIIDEVINTDFEKIEKYLKYLDLSYYLSQEAGRINENNNYKKFKISLQELIKFNKIEIDFLDISNKYKEFENMLIETPTSLSLRYEKFKFKNKNLNTDDIIKLKIHVPLLNSIFNFDFEDMTINTNRFSPNSYYSKKHNPILQKIIGLNYYLLKKYNNFNNFKDEYEKLILK